MTNFKEVKISEIFDFPAIKWLTANFIEQNVWNIPVYWWRQQEKAIWYIKSDLTKVKYFKDCLWWNREGSVWYVFYHKWIFSTNDHHRPLIIKKEFKELIDLNYIKNIFQLLLFSQWFAWSKTASKEKVEKLYIQIPIKENWEFDLEKQKEIALKYEQIEKIKDRLRIMKEDLDSQKIEILLNWKCQEKKLEELFDLSINTNHSKFTKTFVDNNKWNIPVYSASKTENLVWYWFIKDLVDWVKYFENCLTWNIDWSVWKAFFRKWRFTLSEKVIPLILFDNFKEFLDINFLKYNIEIESKKEWFWFSKKAWKWRIKDLILKIPLKDNWEFDLEKQKEIASKYEKIEKIQKTLIEELEYLEKVKVEI
jgi:hypothetical protein